MFEEKNKAQRLQTELDVSEQVQRDFVKLSQTLQVRPGTWACCSLMAGPSTPPPQAIDEGRQVPAVDVRPWLARQHLQGFLCVLEPHSLCGAPCVPAPHTSPLPSRLSSPWSLPWVPESGCGAPGPATWVRSMDVNGVRMRR